MQSICIHHDGNMDEHGNIYVCAVQNAVQIPTFVSIRTIKHN